ncbi:MAG: hypothetical protein Q4E53_11575 [Eubacteriales bacterium]|nr:hypothetical protein [Eubacteriales bacterium]
MKVRGNIPYPCCPKEKNVVYEGAKGKNSSKCPRCGRFILFDYDQMTAAVIGQVKGATKGI